MSLLNKRITYLLTYI